MRTFVVDWQTKPIEVEPVFVDFSSTWIYIPSLDFNAISHAAIRLPMHDRQYVTFLSIHVWTHGCRHVYTGAIYSDGIRITAKLNATSAHVAIQIHEHANALVERCC